MRLPVTIVTNDPAEGRDFVASVGEAIYKPMTHTRPGDDRTLYASVVTPADMQDDNVAGIAATAHLFQERVKHDYAVRLTVVDEQMFAAAIHVHSEASARDWRSD